MHDLNNPKCASWLGEGRCRGSVVVCGHVWASHCGIAHTWLGIRHRRGEQGSDLLFIHFSPCCGVRPSRICCLLPVRSPPPSQSVVLLCLPSRALSKAKGKSHRLSKSIAPCKVHYRPRPLLRAPCCVVFVCAAGSVCDLAPGVPAVVLWSVFSFTLHYIYYILYIFH